MCFEGDGSDPQLPEPAEPIQPSDGKPEISVEAPETGEEAAEGEAEEGGVEEDAKVEAVD